MTSEEYDKLSAEEKRIKVAELCGWHEKEMRFANSEIVYDAWFHKDKGHHCLTDLLPDYLNDLNACHEFEKGLDIDQQLRYEAVLAGVVDCWRHSNWCQFHATAEQRCEAFVLTMGGSQ